MEENRNTQGMNMEDRLAALEKELMGNRRIDPNLYAEYDVKRGLRDATGKGVLTGLTEISDGRASVLSGNQCK